MHEDRYEVPGFDNSWEVIIQQEIGEPSTEAIEAEGGGVYLGIGDS